MALLFIVENGVAKPSTEALLLSPYKEIWERDRLKDKPQAIKEFTYIEFMVSQLETNPFNGYADEVRHDILKSKLFNEEWKPDKLIEQGMAELETFQREGSATYSYYISVLKASQKMKNFFDSFDMNEKNERTGLPIYKPSDITRAMIDTDKVLQNIHSMKRKVEQEVFEQTKTKGNKSINPFEM